jgi:hypothetical protein
LLSSPFPRFLEQFQQVSFLHLLTSIYIICTTSSLHLVPPSLPPLPLGRTCSALLFSNFVEEKT